ncbi:MAG: DNA primase DnaG [Candidatus Thermoplasmatota archaeon]|nr:DNA primase DnaG [Candidatus Thermoplasmatota archaeon]MDD5778022.1 DNA primase DnaG [Candidatus Thermoplasmatota archaeon]
MSIDPSSAKYEIKATIKVDGAVEKSDVIGAVFGQTEGLIGDDLDLRDLQKSARIGRIEVDMSQKKGKSEGTLTLTSALEKVETAIIAAAIESVDRIGPCKAEINIDTVEDVRISKRKHVIDRAKDILAGMISESREEIEDLAETIRQSVQVEEISYYGKDHLPAGPHVDKSDAIIVVEGRNDVINLLRHGVKNAISLEGTSVPPSILELCNEKIATAFVDGDRGGELILKELLQVADIDFVAQAPKTREVEELPYKLIMKALKNKIPTEQYMEMHGMEPPKNNRSKKKKDRDRQEPEQRESKEERKEDRGSRLNDTQKKHKSLLEQVRGDHVALLLDGEGKEIETVKVDGLVDVLSKSKNKVHTVVFDGITTQRLVDAAFDSGVSIIVSKKKGDLSKVPTKLTIVTEDSLQ